MTRPALDGVYAMTETQLVILRDSTASSTSQKKQNAYRIASNNVGAMLIVLREFEAELSRLRAEIDARSEDTKRRENAMMGDAIEMAIQQLDEQATAGIWRQHQVIDYAVIFAAVHAKRSAPIREAGDTTETNA